MNVLYNISRLRRSYGGIFQYSTALLNILGNEIKDHAFFVYYLEDDDYILELINEHDNLHLVKDPEPFHHRLLRYFQSAYNLIAGRIFALKPIPVRSYFRHILRKYEIDIIHSPHQELIGDTKLNIPTIATLHDVQELHFPEYFTPSERIDRAVAHAKAVEHADMVIVSYQHIKNDIIKYFKKESSKTEVILLNMGKLWLDDYSDSILLDTVKDVEIQQEGFILYPAATWPHKNHLALIKALEYIRDKENLTINLICTGHKTDYFPLLQEKISELDLEGQIIFPGVVSEHELYSLYKKAALVVIPTLYEAGSFPLMESLILNVPVICSNVTSLPETMDNSSYIFDPENHEELGLLICRMLSDETFRNENIENCKRASGKLFSNTCTAQLEKVYAHLKP